VGIGGAEAVAQLVLGRHVRDGVVDEDRVERPSQPHGTHVAEDVLAVRVDRATQSEHLRRDVRERAREVPLEVRGVVASTRSELEEGAGTGGGADDQAAIPLGLRRIVLGRGQQVEPGREVSVEAHGGIIRRQP